MEADVLVDSSFLIDCLRRRLDPFEVLAEADEKWEFFTCGAVILEVCRGIRLERAMQRFRRSFAVMSCVPLTNHVRETASDLAWRLDRSGAIMQATDLLIAASALAADAALLTLDSDFRRVPGLRVLDKLEE